MEAEVLEQHRPAAGPASPTRRPTRAAPCTSSSTTSTWPRWPRCGTRAACGRPALRAVHFVIDSAQAATLRQDWVRANTGVALDFVDCPDRRLARAAAETGQRRGGAAGRGGDRGPAPAQLLAAARPAAARPDRGPDRRRGQPDPARRGHDRAVRRAQQGGVAPGRRGGGPGGPGRAATRPRPRLRPAAGGRAGRRRAARTRCCPIRSRPRRRRRRPGPDSPQARAHEQPVPRRG